MVLFLTAVLVSSSVAMAALLYAKHWELSTGQVMFEPVRPRLGEWSHRVISAFEQHLPAAVRVRGRAMAERVRSAAHAWTARAVIAAEHALEKTLTVLRRTTAPHQEATGQVSAFLREVAEHKRYLVRRRKREESARSNADESLMH